MADRSAAQVVRLDAIESLPGPATLRWIPVRHTLGIRAFGCNAYVAAQAGDDVVEPHTGISGAARALTYQPGCQWTPSTGIESDGV